MSLYKKTNPRRNTFSSSLDGLAFICTTVILNVKEYRRVLPFIAVVFLGLPPPSEAVFKEASEVEGPMLEELTIISLKGTVA